MKRTTFTIIYLFLNSYLLAQNPKIDSLQRVLEILEDDTSKVNTLNELSFNMRNIDARLTSEYGQQANQLAQSLDFRKGQAVALRNIALGYKYSGDLDSVKYYCRAAERIAISIGAIRIQADVYNTLATSYWQHSEYDSARVMNEKSRDISKKIKHYNGVAAANLNLGIIYSEQGQYSKAIESYLEALDYFEKENNINGLAVAYNNIANVYEDRDEPDRALTYFLKTSEYDSLTGNLSGRAFTLMNIGNVLFDLGRLSEAKQNYRLAIKLAMVSGSHCQTGVHMTQLGGLFLEERSLDSAYFYISGALRVAKECEDERTLANVYLDMGEYYKIKGELNAAIKALLLGYQAASSQDIKPKMAALADALSEVYELEGNIQGAYKYLKVLHELDSELVNKENTEQITRLEAEYEFQKERDSIAYEQEKIQLGYQQEIERRKTINQAAITGGILVLVILVLLYRSYLIKQKRNVELRHKNELINFKNEELVFKNKEITTLRETEKKMAEETLSLKERELTNITMLSYEKNELLQQIGDQISKIGDKVDDTIIPDLKEIKQTIKSNISTETWNSFTYHFEQVHPDFFNKLRQKYEDLNQNDLRLCAYIKVGLNNKVIAQMSNVTLSAVKKNINRLKKKMDIGPEDSLRSFMLKYS